MTDDATISRFDKGSEHYQTDSIKYRKLSADRVSQLVAPTSTDVILDIGCGTGTQLIKLAGIIKMGIGIDISSGMVQKANDQLKKVGYANLEFHVGDFITPEREILLNKLKINKIICNYALHHLKLVDKKRALEKMISLTGDNLEMIVIGDLMFFDDPENYANQYDQIGYGPGTDLPCYADELTSLFEGSAFTVTLDRIHPLVGVLKAIKRVNP